VVQGVISAQINPFTKGDQDGLKFLLDNGANPSQVWPATGETPMHLVCQSRNNLSCVVNLLQAGPDVNSQRLDGK